MPQKQARIRSRVPAFWFRALVVLGLFFLTACSHNAASPVDASSPVVAIGDAGVALQIDASVVDAAVARVNCAEPTKLTQLGTVNDVGTFSYETLIGRKHSYDPETLSTTGRFLVSEKGDDRSFWDLRGEHPSAEKAVDVGWKDGPVGEGLFLAQIARQSAEARNGSRQSG